MANKPFEIQSSTLTIGGVDLQAGTTGVVIPGVTQAIDYFVEEVDERGDQTVTFQSAPILIDYVTYLDYENNGSSSGRAEYSVDEIDDDGYIDGINIDSQGSYTGSEAYNGGNDLFAYTGTDTMPGIFVSFVGADWTQIPFRPRMRAGEIENVGGGSGNTLTNGDWTASLNDAGSLRVDNTDDEQNYFALTPVSNEDNTYGLQIGIDNQASWQFLDNGTLEFPDGTQIGVLEGSGTFGLNNPDGNTQFLISASEDYWTFNGATKNLELPPNGDIVDSTGNSVLGSGSLTVVAGDGSGGTTTVENVNEILFSGLVTDLNDGTIGITTNALYRGEHILELGEDGNLTFPDGSIQTTAYIGQEISPSVPRSDTAPVAANGQLWFNTLEGRMYIKYDGAWVDAAPLMTPAPELNPEFSTITFPDASVQTTAFTGSKLFNNDYEVILDEDGALNLPRRGVIRNLDGTHDVNIVGTGPNGFAQLQWTTEAGAAEDDPNGTDELKHWLYIEEPGVFIETNLNGTGDSHEWHFKTDGTTQFPNGVIKAPPGDNTISMQSQNSKNNVLVGDSQIIISTENTTAYNWAFETNGVLTLPSSSYLESSDNNLKVGAQGSVTIRSNAASGAGLKAWTFGTDGNLTLPTNTSAINYSNGVSILAGLGGGSSYGNSNVTSYLPTHTGNVSANYFLGNVAGGNVSITGQLNVSGTVTSNFIPQSNITYSLGNSTNRWKDIYLASSTVYLGNVELSEGAGNSLSVVGNISTTGTLYTSGLVSTSMLSATGGLSVTGGNILTSGGIYANFDISTAGNVTGNYFLGNGSQLTGITATNATTAGTVTTNAQPNITSVGTLSGLTVGPNSSIVLSGTTGYLKANSLQGHDGSQTIYLHYGEVGGAAGIATNLTVGTTGSGNLTTNGTISASGNVTGSYFLGNGSQLTGITATTAATVTTNAQPNITSVGTLSSLSISGNITSGNILTGGVVSSTGTITGGNLTTGGQVSATGNVTGANLITTGLLTVTGNVIGGNVNTANTISATGNIRSNSSFIATTVAGTISVGNTNSFMMGIGNTDNFMQSYVHNKSNTSVASADMIVYNSSGTDTIGYMDMGIASNNFSSVDFAVTGKSEGYVFMSGVPGTSGNMVFATGSTGSNNSIEFYVGGFNSAKGANRPLLLTKALTTVTGNLSVTGNIIGNGAGLTNVTVSAAGNIVGTQSNISLVAGSYTATFDNTGVLTLPTVGGDEGGEINFGIPTSNTTLTSTVKLDVYQDRIRFYDGSTKGVYIDLSQAGAGVSTLLNNRVSGFVNAGTFVTMDLIKATVTTTGSRGLSLATTTGSFNYSIGGAYGAGGTGGGGSGTGTLTTTPTASIFGWGFTATGDIATYILTDTTNSRCYRITVQIGASFNNNSIIIERLI